MGIRNGVYIEYFKNGKLREKSNFVNNKLYGKFESYYEHGVPYLFNLKVHLKVNLKFK